MFFLSFVYFRCSLNRKAKHVQFASRKVYRCLEVKIINSVECFSERRGVLKGCLNCEAGGGKIRLANLWKGLLDKSGW